jgi:hypothetical protein
MQHINFGILLDGEHEPLPLRDLDGPEPFDGQRWHIE